MGSRHYVVEKRRFFWVASLCGTSRRCDCHCRGGGLAKREANRASKKAIVAKVAKLEKTVPDLKARIAGFKKKKGNGESESEALQVYEQKLFMRKLRMMGRWMKFRGYKAPSELLRTQNPL